MKKQTEPAEAIIITVGAKMYSENGYRHWLRHFLDAMEPRHQTEMYYWFRQGTKPKNDKSIQYVYLCIGGKIRYRAYYAGSHGEGEIQFDNKSEPMYGKAWILVGGPIERAPMIIKKQGFQGFRYTHKLF